MERWRGLKILRGLGWAFHQLERGYVGGKTDPQGLALAGEERESAGELAREVLLLAGELMVGWREMAGDRRRPTVFSPTGRGGAPMTRRPYPRSNERYRVP